MSTKIRQLNAKSMTDEDVVGLSWPGRLVWAYLPCYADREGRLDDKPASLRIEMLPENPEIDIDEIFNDFQRLGFITRYQVDGKAYIQIKSWSRYQKPYPREPASNRPGPNGELPDQNLGDLEDQPDLSDQTISVCMSAYTQSSNHTDKQAGEPDAPPYDREGSWELTKKKWLEAGRWPKGENLVAARKKFHTKIDFRNWPRFWQGLNWAVQWGKEHERQYLGVLCTFLDEAKWKDWEAPEPEEEKPKTDRATAISAMGY